MRRVAVFGNAGGGKSTLARRLAAATELPLHVIDEMQFRAGGVAVPEDEYLGHHAELLRCNEWIIDGFGGMRAAWDRFSASDTLVLVDLPLITHYWWVTKRADPRALRDTQRLAAGQSGLEQLHEQLSRHLALPYASHPEISRADRRERLLEARLPLALSRRDRRVHRSSGPRALLRHRARVTWLTPITG